MNNFLCFSFLSSGSICLDIQLRSACCQILPQTVTTGAYRVMRYLEMSFTTCQLFSVINNMFCHHHRQMVFILVNQILTCTYNNYRYIEERRIVKNLNSISWCRIFDFDSLLLARLCQNTRFELLSLNCLASKWKIEWYCIIKTSI